MCLPTNISDGYHVWHSQEAIEIKLGNQSSQLQAIMSLNSAKVFERLPFSCVKMKAEDGKLPFTLSCTLERLLFCSTKLLV